MSAYASRIERLRALFDEAKIDGMLISQPESRFYLSGYTGHDLPPRDSAGYLMIGKTGAILLTDPRTSEQAEQEATDYTVVAYSPSARQGQRLIESVQELGITKLGFESIHLPHAFWQAFSDAVGEKGVDLGDDKKIPGPGVEMVPVKDLVDKLRIEKDAEELTSLQAAIDVLDDCFMHIAKNELRVGRTENLLQTGASFFVEDKSFIIALCTVKKLTE